MFKLVDFDSNVLLPDPMTCLQQPHQGIISKRMDPYLTILRSKPRYNLKLPQEPVIILLGAKKEDEELAVTKAKSQG